jgi:hypothetical protein
MNITLDQAFSIYPQATAWWNSGVIVELTMGSIVVWER